MRTPSQRLAGGGGVTVDVVFGAVRLWPVDDLLAAGGVRALALLEFVVEMLALRVHVRQRAVGGEVVEQPAGERRRGGCRAVRNDAAAAPFGFPLAWRCQLGFAPASPSK
jgi:hypothetical protein